MPRQRKLSNKSVISYYAQDLTRKQDGQNLLLSHAPTTLLNTHGLDSKPGTQIDCRDNSKIINHLSKKTSKDNILVNTSQGSLNYKNTKVNNQPNSTKQSNLVNTVKLNNQILLNQNNQMNIQKNERPQIITGEINSILVRDNGSDLCSTSASSILASSSSQISSKSSKSSKNSQISSIQYPHPQSQSSSTFIDNKKSNHLRHIQETDDFESEPNLLVNSKEYRAKQENSRKLALRARSSFLNQSLNETNRELTRSYTESSEINIEVHKNQATDEEDLAETVSLN